jgi:eukaryotic-like serine/threonine-protein kinase
MLICRDQRTGTGCGAQNSDDARRCQQCGRSLRYALEIRDPGSLVGSYRIVRVIGHGGFGAVYEVEVAQRPDIRVALKETFDLDSLHSFQSEFAVLRSLRHDNLPRYYEVFEADGHGYLVMELVAGQSLDDILRKHPGPVLEKLVLHYADQLCDVLSYLHDQSQPIIHRDVKPANIRLTPEGLIKLVDFGLFKQGTDTTHSLAPRAGTVSYAPLEQWIGGTDQRTDIYGLGATLYHLLTGQPPIPASIRNAVAPDPLAPPVQHNPRLSPSVSEVIMNAMRMSREERYADMISFQQMLMRAPQKGRGTAPLSSLPQPPTQPPSVSTTRTPDTPVLTAATPTLPTHIAGAHPHHHWQSHGNIINALAWSPDGQMLASASDDGTIRLWRLDAQRMVDEAQVLQSFTGPVFGVAWSPDGQTLASGSKDQVIRLWRAVDGRLIDTWPGHTASVFCVAWSPDGQTLASGSWDKTVRLWRVADGSPLTIYVGHTHSVNGLAWSPSGRTLASASADTKVRLWRVSDGAMIAVLQGHQRSVYGVAWDPDGQLLASASADKTVRLWRAAGSALLATLQEHTNNVNSVAWSSNGQAFASGSADKTVRLWRGNDGALLATLQGHADHVTSVAWNPDNQLLASACADRTIHLWQVEYH